MNILYAFEHGNVVLASVFLLLVGMSFASWYIIFWKMMKLRKEQRQFDEFQITAMQKPDWPLHYSTKPDGSVGKLIRTAESLNPVLSRYDADGRKEILAMQLSQELDVVRSTLDKGLTVLASVGSSAPFIGLFGTVWGIYGALTKIATEGNAGINVVAGPMGEALVATAIGLFAAIPAVLAYNGFVRKNRLLVQNLRHLSEQLTAYLSLVPSASEKSKLREVTGARII